jgi:hypothetical protein
MDQELLFDARVNIFVRTGAANCTAIEQRIGSDASSEPEVEWKATRCHNVKFT